MRVLMVNNFAYVTGGADKQCISLAKLLRERGHEVAFLSVDDERNLETGGAFVPCLVTHETRDLLAPRQRLRVLKNAIWNSDASRAMKSVLGDFRPDIVHAHKLYPQLSVSPIVIARQLGFPVVQTLHDYELMSANPLDDSGDWRDRSESRLSYRLLNTITFATRRRLHAPTVSGWIAVSEYVARAYVARGISSTVIRNFADMEPRSLPPGLSDRHGLVFVGRLSVEKGVLDFLDVARQLATERFVLAGRGPLQETVIRTAEELPNVEFKGPLEPAGVRDALSSARVAVVPSRWAEPGGLVVLEAMAMGTPIVAYRNGGLSEYVSATNAGLIVDPDSGSLAAACRSLLVDDGKWAECSAHGLRATVTELSKDAHVRSVLDVYERVRRT